MIRICILVGIMAWTTAMGRTDVDNVIPERVWADFVPAEQTSRSAHFYGFIQHFEAVLHMKVDKDIRIYIDLKVLKAIVDEASKKDQEANAITTDVPVIDIARERTYRDMLDLFCFGTGASWKLDGKRLLIFNNADSRRTTVEKDGH